MKFTTACLAILLTLPISASIGQESQAQGKAVEAAPDSATAAWADSLPRIGMLDAIVVTASRTAQRMKDAPAAVTVFDEQKVRDLPATYYTDYMRMAAGVNAVEFSAGDQSINPRSAAGTIPLGLLTLVDNRAVYNDFNGQTFWNSFQIDPSEIKQIEVLRGPSSVVWGANALDGVVNIITKSPREMQGTYLKLGGGSVSGQDAQDTGGIFNAALTHAGARGKFGYKLSGSYLKQEAYPRPTGTIPGTGGPGNPFPGGQPRTFSTRIRGANS